MKLLKRFLKILWKIFRFILILILIPIFLYCITWSFHRVHALVISEESEWIRDLDKLEESLLTHHANPDWAGTVTQEVKGKIDSTKQHVRNSEGDLDRDKMRVALMKVSALLKDGHTHIANYADDVGGFPIRTKFYKDGLYIVEADSSISEILGHKITGVNGHPIEKVLQKIKTISPSVNESGYKMYGEIYIRRPGFLYGLGLTDNNKKATFEFIDLQGSKQRLELDGFSEESGMINLNALDNIKISKYRENRSAAYWYEYEPDTKLLYMKYNSVSEMPNQSMPDFINELMEVADSKDIDKFIIDLRNNGGGNNFLTTKLVAEIQKRPKINKKGVLYAITGHRTFSAAICFATNLSTKTKATFVGVPFADHNNLPGDALFYDLHMNRMTWQVSELFWENTYYDDLYNTFSPTIPYNMSFEEELSGVNPVLDKIMKDTLFMNIPKWELGDETYSSYNGRYEFSPDKTLHLNLTQGNINISGLMESDLIKINDSTFHADNLRFDLMTANNQITLLKADGNSRVLEKLGNDEFTALELIQNESYDKAKEAYKVLFSTYGNKLDALAANNLSTTAIYLYHNTGNNEMQRALLDVAVEYHPNSVMANGRMAASKDLDGESMGALGSMLTALWNFDWKNVDNYGKAFGFF